MKNRPARIQLMKAIDAINCKYGPNAISLAAAGVNEEQAWQSKSTYRSGNYMTDINDLLTIDMDKVYDQDDE